MSNSATRSGSSPAVVGENGRREVPIRLGASGVPEDRRQGIQESLSERPQRLDQRRIITRVFGHGRQESIDNERRNRIPVLLKLGGSGACQGTGGTKAFFGVRIRIT